MRYFITFFFIIQILHCKQESPYIKSDNITEQKNRIIDSIELSLIKEQITDKRQFNNLKKNFRNALEKDFERPYMWDIFVDSNDTLLQFYKYSDIIINDEKIKTVYIKIEYEDADYEALMLVSDADIEYHRSLIIYEKLKSEEYYIRTSLIKNNTITILFNKEIKDFISSYIYTSGLFLDYFLENNIHKKWKTNTDDYELKGNTKNHLKEGAWIEKKYVFDYNTSVVEKGNYHKGIRVDEWKILLDGKIDKIIKYKNGKIISVKHP